MSVDDAEISAPVAEEVAGVDFDPQDADDLADPFTATHVFVYSASHGQRVR